MRNIWLEVTPPVNFQVFEIWIQGQSQSALQL